MTTVKTMNIDLKTVTLGGYTLDEIRLMNRGVHQDAAKFISDAMEIAQGYMKQLLDAGEEGTLKDLDVAGIAATANEYMEAINTVAMVSGYEFYLPYRDQWGYDDGDVFSVMLENLSSEQYEDWKNVPDELSGLINTLENMEYDSRNWHQSTC